MKNDAYILTDGLIYTNEIARTFKEAMAALTNQPMAAAILVLAQQLAEANKLQEKNLLNNADHNHPLSHEICMGIRHGLFRVNAATDSNILDRNTDKEI